MVPLTSLWLPILLSGVIVFVASSIIHMMLGYHRADYRKMPSENQVQEALRKFDIPPGDYMMPCPETREGMKKPEFLDRRNKGPVAILTVLEPGPVNMGPSLGQWFVYCLVVSGFAAYITGRALGPGAAYLSVFRFAGCVAFTGYALALWQDSIWLKKAWGTTLRHTFDGLVYGLVTAGTFGWLWPR